MQMKKNFEKREKRLPMQCFCTLRPYFCAKLNAKQYDIKEGTIAEERRL
jgi:hypothetical protein